MFVFCKNGRLAYYWNAEKENVLFLENNSAVVSTRVAAVSYLESCGFTRERAAQVVTLMKKSCGVWMSV